MSALLLGVVAMHHVAGAGHADGHDPAHEAAADDHHESAAAPSSAEHGLAHLCLAVLTAAALLLAGRLLLGRRLDLGRRARDVVLSGRTFRARPPPRPHGAALLTSLGVSRT